jgi:hypothetical protein
MQSTGIGAGILEITSALLGIALIALILNRSRDAANLINSSSNAFGGLLKIVTLQGGFNNSPSYWG